MSTAPTSTTPPASQFDAQLAYELHPKVEIRPEPFGALLYSFKTRRLSFLKDPLLVTVVRSLGDQPSARDACLAAGVEGADRLAQFEHALATLAATETIRERRP